MRDEQLPLNLGLNSRLGAPTQRPAAILVQTKNTYHDVLPSEGTRIRYISFHVRTTRNFVLEPDCDVT